jgi:hypothetical protein
VDGECSPNGEEDDPELVIGRKARRKETTMKTKW